MESVLSLSASLFLFEVRLLKVRLGFQAGWSSGGVIIPPSSSPGFDFHWNTYLEINNV